MRRAPGRAATSPPRPSPTWSSWASRSGRGQNARVALGDWGYAITLEKAVVRKQGTRNGYRGFVTGLHVVLTAAHGGLPAGTEIMIGYGEAAASASKPKPAAAPAATTGPRTSRCRRPRRRCRRRCKPPPPDVEPKFTAAGYVFPIYGPASISDSFGAPRTTTWHHGVDIFAPLGAPLLAVADGTLFRVGWNDVGGNRLWLRDGAGNEFYYAHLSAFSPLAQEGAQVKAGDVIGFVGNTGDAITTPPHLHFEIHPRELLWMGYDGAIDPYPYLSAWLRLDDLAFGSWDPVPARRPRPARCSCRPTTSRRSPASETARSRRTCSPRTCSAKPSPAR